MCMKEKWFKKPRCVGKEVYLRLLMTSLIQRLYGVPTADYVIVTGKWVIKEECRT